MIEIEQETEQHTPVRGRGRGFASMTREQHQSVASRGGKTTQARGTGNRFTSETARLAGRKGGSRPRAYDHEQGETR